MENQVTYKRQGDRGTLTLSGVIDIFEAKTLYDTACHALNDTKAKRIQVNLTQSERLDVSALQILLALRRDVTRVGRTFAWSELPANLAAAFEQGGITL